MHTQERVFQLSSALLLLLCLTGTAVQAQPVRDVGAACAAIAGYALPQTEIVSAEPIVTGSAYTVPGTENGLGLTAPVDVHRSFCRVAGVVEPAIRFEVWMPLENWNGRFRGVGLGAFYGKLPYAVMAEALDQGYAVGGTDTGHQSEAFDGTWAMRDGQLNRGIVEDWTHRGIHEMTVKSQAIVAEVYGRPANYSYFTGCSSGGFQAMTEAQRYPDDYDGILAGAPANFITHLQAAQMSFGLATQLDPAANLFEPINKLPMLHEAVIDACDALDGVEDGLIENPAVCPFEPKQVECNGADSASCLTAPQVQAVERIYADIVRRDGTKIFPGFPKGSEANWHLMAGGYLGSVGQVQFAQDMYRYFVFQNPDWDYRTMDLERDVAYADRHAGELLNSNDPDLRPFRDRGGKLIQYHGWADWGITPYSSIDYFNAVTETVGGAMTAEARRDVQDFHRLFLMPGMSHCRGGAGPDKFDGLGALEAWVERGEAPERMVAAKEVDDEVVRTRPLCPYPAVARYNGTGSSDDAQNFVCEMPADAL